MFYLAFAILCVHFTQGKVPLIIDTDIGGGGCHDVDDVGALCVANALADNDEVELLAVVQNTKPSQCAAVISVVNHFYGRDHVPIGAYKGDGLGSNASYLSYVTDLAENWPSPIKNATQVQSGVEVYRRALVAEDDHSVTISSIGLLTNLAALLRSGPDAISPLSGRELVGRKVRLLAVMGGEFPSSLGKSAGCNFCACAFGEQVEVATAVAATSYVFANIPSTVRIAFVGAGVGFRVSTGGILSSCAPAANPCRQAYIDYEGAPGKSRYSWDLLTTLIAVRGPGAAGGSYCQHCDGVIEVDPRNAANTWKHGPPSNQTYFVLVDPEFAARTLDQLLCQPPKAATATLDTVFM
eukprot:TRINITY_DN73120_c0_g1_i1.p1 TRINITY_DN73120_c0_g1~~TRINITY_DN73120_c0_g1_i1.p1  ORF type:complete len:353 (+),score=19.58 TRINITY_DN73120_c0_g1_i1:60-1118(+)